MISGSLGTNFHVALETGLKIDRFSGLPGGTPEFRTRTSRVPKYLFPGAVEDHLAGLRLASRLADLPAMLQSSRLASNASQHGGPKGPADFKSRFHVLI